MAFLLKCCLKISGYLSHHERTPTEGRAVRVWEAEAAEGPTGDEEGDLSSCESSPSPGNHPFPPLQPADRWVPKDFRDVKSRGPAPLSPLTAEGSEHLPKALYWVGLGS